MRQLLTIQAGQEPEMLLKSIPKEPTHFVPGLIEQLENGPGELRASLW